MARRLQDPLAELVKIDAQHLGVGSYQLELPIKKLQDALSDVVSECVSLVGVNVNTSSPYLLRYVPGMNLARANSIFHER